MNIVTSNAVYQKTKYRLVNIVPSRGNVTTAIPVVAGNYGASVLITATLHSDAGNMTNVYLGLLKLPYSGIEVSPLLMIAEINSTNSSFYIKNALSFDVNNGYIRFYNSCGAPIRLVLEVSKEELIN